MDNVTAFEMLGLTPKDGKLTAEQINKVRGLGVFVTSALMTFLTCASSHETAR